MRRFINELSSSYLRAAASLGEVKLKQKKNVKKKKKRKIIIIKRVVVVDDYIGGRFNLLRSLQGVQKI